MKLGDMIEQYICYRRSLGEKFKTNASVLRNYARFIKDIDAKDITYETNERFLISPNGDVTAHWFCKHTALKGLFQWALSREYMDTIPLPTELPIRKEHIRPYIYSNKELKSIFDNALVYQKNRSTTYPECVRYILMLTYMLGLRIHETMSLKIKDVDMFQSVVLISESKFYKSRILPFNTGVRHLLEECLRWRQNQGMGITPEDYLWLDRKGRRMSVDTLRGIFCRIRENVGIVRNDGAVYQPRLHDLRHTFCVNRLTSWYREGKDVQKLLPVLSTYMGHKHLSHTSVYLSMTEGLLGEANSRYAQYVNDMESLHYEKRR